MRTCTKVLALLGAVLALGVCADGSGVDVGVDGDRETHEDDSSKNKVIVSGGSALTPRVLMIMESMPLLHRPGQACRPPRSADPWSIHPSEVIRCQPERVPMSEAEARDVVRKYIEAATRPRVTGTASTRIPGRRVCEPNGFTY